MKGLANLIRLHKLKLTEQQKRLNDLQAVAQGFLNELQAIDQRARDEAADAGNHAETAFMLGGFVQASLARRAALQSSLAEINREMGIIRDRVASAFRELKRYELIAERHAADLARSQRRRERRTEDELGMTMFRRKGQNGTV